jgi:two-component system, OmpR family, sensor histidine kinase VicK
MTNTSKESDLIKVITGSENITNFMLQSYPRAKVKMDTCYDLMGPSVISTDKRIMNAVLDLINRGIKIRLITDVTKENIEYCKELLKVSEIRHIEGIKGNFGIIDEVEYVIHLISKESEAPSRIIYSNDTRSAEAQQFLFNALWKNAISIEERIKEIEQGTRREFLETLRDYEEIERIYLEMIMSTTKELLLLFPTVNAFHRLERNELMQLLKKITKRGVQIRILTPMDKEIKIIVNKIFDPIEINPVVSQQGLNSTIIVSDNKSSLVIELKDDNKYSFGEANGLAIYSNRMSSVWTHTTIFENLWVHSNSTI